MKTIAQQLKVKDFPFEIKDEQGNQIYFEDSNGYWSKREYDEQGNEIYCENIDNFWFKREYDEQGNEIYYENSNGFIDDNREEIIEVNGVKYKRLC